MCGDKQARADLATHTRPQVYAWCLRALEDPDLAADATQDVLVRLWTHVACLQYPRAFPTWLYRITLNACNRQLRARRAPVMQGKDIADQPDHSPSPEDIALARHEIDLMLCVLSSSERELVELKFGRGLSGKQIGKVLRTSEGAARVRVHGVLKRLRGAFRRGEDVWP